MIYQQKFLGPIWSLPHEINPITQLLRHFRKPKRITPTITDSGSAANSPITWISRDSPQNLSDGPLNPFGGGAAADAALDDSLGQNPNLPHPRAIANNAPNGQWSLWKTSRGCGAIHLRCHSRLSGHLLRNAPKTVREDFTTLPLLLFFKRVLRTIWIFYVRKQIELGPRLNVRF